MCLLPGYAGQQSQLLSLSEPLHELCNGKTFSGWDGVGDGLFFKGGSRVSSAKGCPPGLNFTIIRDLKHCLELPFPTPAKLCSVPNVGRHSRLTH